MIRFIIRAVFTHGIMIIFFIPEIFAQGGSGGAPYGPPRGGSGGAPYGPGNSSDGGESVPIDGGAALLLAAGASYGIKKIKERRTNAKDSSL